MPDYHLWATTLLLAGAAAAALLLALAWPWRTLHPLRYRLGWVLAIGIGYYLGCAWLDLWPRWSIREERDRFLVILLPLTLLAEFLAALPMKPRGWTWLPRLAVAGAAAPILLYRTSYLADLAGPGSAEWSSAQAVSILTGLGAVLAIVWMLLALLQARTGARTISLALALTCLAAGLTVMLSGCVSGGLLALPLAGALTGATLASFAAPNMNRSVGVGVIGLFSVLLIGRFFCSLPTSAGCCLLLAPLLAWLPEGPGLRRLWPGVRAGLRVAFVAGLLIYVVLEARQRFLEESAANAFGP